MNPLLDHLLVITALSSAVGYFLWHSFRRTKKGGSGCGSGCGCGEEKKPGPPA
jgi:hypothetical protein